MIYLKRIIEEMVLYEGLEITHSISTTMRMINTWGIYHKNNSKIYIQRNEDNNIQLNIIESSKDEFDNILRLINNLGWFPSIYYDVIISHKYKYNEVLNLIENKKPILVILESKFDIQLDNDDMMELEELYHTSPSKNEEKILKIGLAPKSKEKMMRHPERIYFTMNFEDAKFLAEQKKFNSGERQMTIFSINNELLFQRRKIRFFEDPNYEGGIYTYENIPPQFISVVERVNV